MLALVLCACSRPPRDEYADTLFKSLDKIHAALLKYTQDPSGVTEVGGEGPKGRRSVAVDVALCTREFFDSLTTVKYSVFKDIQDMSGYEAWADELSKKLRERADPCLKIVREIKNEYKQNVSNAEYRQRLVLNNIPERRYPLLWLTKEDDLVFDVGARMGVPVEQILRVDFRTTFDSLRNRGREQK
jgi:hypothetical protein